MDWYLALFGRPAPGQRAQPTRASRYLDDYDPSREGYVYGPGGVVDEGDEAPRRARTRGSFARDSAYPAAPDWASRTSDARSRRRRSEPAQPGEDYVFGPGGVIDVEPEAPSAPRVPFSALAGTDGAPFGEDFALWYETTRGRPLPPVLRAAIEAGEAAPDEGRRPSNADNLPADVEGGSARVAEGPEGAALSRARRITLAPIEGPQWDAARQAGIVPTPDPTQEWIAAEERAFLRQREGRPTAYDMMFLAIFGPRRKPDESKQLMSAREVADAALERQRREDAPSDERVRRDPFTGEEIIELPEDRRRREREAREDQERIERAQGLRVSDRGRLEYRRRF